jgi:hypothetical protein
VERRTKVATGRSPALVDLVEHALTVVAVDQEPIGQHLDPLAEVGDLLGGRVVVAHGEAQLRDLAGGVLADQVERRALGGDDAPVHDDQPVAQLLGLVHVVGRDHQRLTPAA